MKVITICGSMKYKKEMMEIGEKLGLKGNCILTPLFTTKQNKDEYTKEDIENLKLAHFKRIELSDTILVVNVDGYIGESTTLEMNHAKALGKEIIYYTDLINENN